MLYHCVLIHLAHVGVTLWLLLTEEIVVSASEPSGSEAQGFRPHRRKGTAQSRNWKDINISTKHTVKQVSLI